MNDDRAAAIAHLRAALHPTAFVDDTQLRGYGVHGCKPQCVVFPVQAEALRRCLEISTELGLAVIPTGMGARMRLGAPPHRYEVSLCTRDLARIVNHEAADMTVTVEAGCPLTTLNGTLARTGQWVPIDPPLPERTTVGGLIATDASGPLRLSHGKVRDLLIGVRVALADGRSIRGGGRVVKNVAGYDLMKLFTGSLGTLGVIVEATFKVRPRPAQTSLLILDVADVRSAANCAGEILSAGLEPLYVELINASAGAGIGLSDASCYVLVGLGGSAEEIAAQQERLRKLANGRGCRDFDRAETARLYTAVRDWPEVSIATSNVCGAAISVLPSRLDELTAALEGLGEATRLVAHAGNGTVYVRRPSEGNDAGDCRWLQRVRELAADAGGFARFDAMPPNLSATLDPWGDEVPGLPLMRGIKAALDPQQILSPGRFAGGI